MSLLLQPHLRPHVIAQERAAGDQDGPRKAPLVGLHESRDRREEGGTHLGVLAEFLDVVHHRGAREDRAGIEQLVQVPVEPPADGGIVPGPAVVDPGEPEGLQRRVIHVPEGRQHRHRNHHPER